MNKIDRHIVISEELHNKILTYMKESRNNYSEEISAMIEEAISNRIKQEKLNDIYKNILTLTRKTNLIYELLKQLYSDLDLTNITDVKKSYALNEFFNRIKTSKFDD